MIQLKREMIKMMKVTQEDAKRQTKKPSYLNDYELYEAYRMGMNEVPKSFEEAYKDEKWRRAIEDGVNSIKENETWVEVEDTRDKTELVLLENSH
ncbi:hypothetical protein HHI36_006293 [Cryptolaemus montrouzieri]|uniref:Uncharacterized protein n=1 Tax=Cryptolaemus montrouzieri TaxID=559131 RepID=A0ABD2NWQ6_9CUCU